MPAHVLALYLDAPLQSWGYQSRFDRRTSLSYPTRSGIVGMLCAALGVDRRDRSGLERVDKGISIQAVAFGEASQLIDFHTVGGGFDSRVQGQSIVSKADGSRGDTVVTRREYLQGARFGVLVSGEPALLDELSATLNDPKWGIWLGRKSCIPASPVSQGVFASGEEALLRLEKLAGCKATRQVTEVERFDEGSETLLDRPVDFATREFKPRRVADEPL
jgi:CRISPR system Cascade subunit CasD